MPTYDHGVSGLTGTIGVTILHPDGTVHAARATEGITEPVAGSGVYHVAHPAPGTLYGFVFDGGVGTIGASTWDDGLTAPAAAPSTADIKTAIEAAGSHLALIKAKSDNLPADTNTLLVTTGIKVATNADKTGYSGVATNMVAEAPSAADNAAATAAQITVDHGVGPYGTALPGTGVTITPATIGTDGTALGKVMPHGEITATADGVDQYAFVADHTGDYSFVLPLGDVWTLTARLVGQYLTTVATVSTIPDVS